MAVNYLQYIGSVQQSGITFPNVRFLVSGVDTKVRQIVGQNIVSSAYDRGKTLFIVDERLIFYLLEEVKYKRPTGLCSRKVVYEEQITPISGCTM